MAKITNVRWFGGGYGGSLSIEVDGSPALIPIGKDFMVKKGYVYIRFRDQKLDDAGILPTVVFQANQRKGTNEVTVPNCVKSPKLVRYWKEAFNALEDGTFEDGKLIDPGPIEV